MSGSICGENKNGAVCQAKLSHSSLTIRYPTKSIRRQLRQSTLSLLATASHVPLRNHFDYAGLIGRVVRARTAGLIDKLRANGTEIGFRSYSRVFFAERFLWVNLRERPGTEVLSK